MVVRIYPVKRFSSIMKQNKPFLIRERLKSVRNMVTPYEKGDPVLVIEKTHTGEKFEWTGEVTQVTDAFVETVHRRNPLSHPQWQDYIRAYEKIWTKHYGGLDGIHIN